MKNLGQIKQAVAGKSHQSLGSLDKYPRDIKGKIGIFADIIDMNVCGLCDYFDLDINSADLMHLKISQSPWTSLKKVQN